MSSTHSLSVENEMILNNKKHFLNQKIPKDLKFHFYINDFRRKSKRKNTLTHNICIGFVLGFIGLLNFKKIILLI